MEELNNLAKRLTFRTHLDSRLPEFNKLILDLNDVTRYIYKHFKMKKEEIKENILHKFEGTFIPKIIIHNLKKNTKTICIILYITDIKLSFLISYTKINIKKFFIMAFKALVVSTYLKIRTNKKGPMHIKIYYTPSLEKKKMGLKNEIGPNECNSGFTRFFFNKPDYICIFREEENSKVLIHELLHYFNLDFSSIRTHQLNTTFIQNFDVDTNMKYVNVFEAFVDFYAILINSIMTSILFKLKLDTILKMEKMYQKKLCKKIMSKFKMTHILKNKNKTNNKLIQKSNVLSYYFIKNILTQNILKTFQYFPLLCTWDEKKIQDFYSFILTRMNTTKKIKIEKCKPHFSLKMTYFNL